MKKIIYILLGLFATSESIFAQTLDDAIRYSMLPQGGTARVAGVGGAFGAMGGDAGIMITNVAGIADFRTSEFNISFGLNAPNTSSIIGGNNIGGGEDNLAFRLESLAIVFARQPEWAKRSTSNFAISYQNYARYDETLSYEASSIGSLTEYFTDQANYVGWNDFESELAFQTGAIFDIGGPNDVFYGSDLAFGDFTDKDEIIERSGSYSELSMAWAGKFPSGLSFGVGVGFPFVTFSQRKFYSESDVDNSPEGFNQLNFTQNLSATGTGVNMTLGLGYTLAKKFRFGLGFKTPSLISMQEEYFTSLFYSCGDCNDVLQESPLGEFSYNLRTPMQTTLSLGYLMIKENINGFFNIDLDYYNFGMARFGSSVDDSGDQDYFDDLNTMIQSDLSDGFTFGVGGELAVKKVRVRGGFKTLLKPYFNEVGTNKVLGVGAGYRLNRVYADIAYQYMIVDEGYLPYPSLDADGFNRPERELFMTNEYRPSKVMLTLGIKL